MPLEQSYRLSVFYPDALRTKRGTLSDGVTLLLPAGLPDEILAGSDDAPLFSLTRDRDAAGRHPSAEELALIAPHLPTNAEPVTPVTDPGQIELRKSYARETLQAAPTPPEALFSGPSYDYQTPHAWAVAGFLGRLLALSDADARELASGYVRVPASEMLAAVRASGYGAPDAIGLELDEENAARLLREKAEEDAVRRNAEEAVRKYPYSGLLVLKCSKPRPRDSIAGLRFAMLPHGVPVAIAHTIYGGFEIPFPNYDIEGCGADRGSCRARAPYSALERRFRLRLRIVAPWNHRAIGGGESRRFVQRLDRVREDMTWGDASCSRTPETGCSNRR